MTKPHILVTGATGKTGAATIEQLLALGYPVRALARVHDERSKRLEALGAEVVLGDFHDIASIRRALKGVKRAYFCYPPQGKHLVDATAIFAIAARDEGVEAIVNMSQITVREDAPSPLTRQHWQGEHVLDFSGINVTHVRPTFFAENLVMFGAATIAVEGKLYLPFGDEQHAPVSASDIARVVTAILDNPDAHAGQRYVLTGPEKFTLAEITDELSAVLGKPVEYIDLPIDAWGDVLRTVDGMSESLVTHLKFVAGDYHNGVFNAANNTVERITGRPAQTLAEFITEFRSAFASSATPAAA